MPKLSIATGALFNLVDGYGRMNGWVVEQMFDHHRIPHASIRSVSDPSRIKTVAVSVLMSDRHYIQQQSAG